MRRYVVSGAWGVVAMLVAAPLVGQTSLSIYRDGRVVVRQSLPQALQRGRNALTLKLEGLDPATLFSSDTAVSVMSAEARYPSTRDDALARSVGRTLSFSRGTGDTVKATVVRVAPPQYRVGDGRLLLESPGEPLFPAELVRTSPEAAVVLEAARAATHRAGVRDAGGHGGGAVSGDTDRCQVSGGRDCDRDVAVAARRQRGGPARGRGDPAGARAEARGIRCA